MIAPVRIGVALPKHPPIWIAGNSAAAIERAARDGDGWHGIDLSPAELASLVVRVRERAESYGRNVCITLRQLVAPGGAGERPLHGERATIREHLEAYRAAGLDYLVASLPRTGTEDEAVRALEQVARVLLP